MRMKMTPTEILQDFLDSEGFEELVAARLKLSLENTFDTLDRLSALDQFNPYQFDDYSECIRYGRSLAVVLEWFTTEDWEEAHERLNKYTSRLNSDFYE